MQVKLIIVAIAIIIFGGMYANQMRLKSIIAEQATEIVKYEADTGKLIKEIELMKEDKLSLENGVAALQEYIKDKDALCEVRVAGIEKKYQILLKRQFTETKKVIEGGAIDETTSQYFIEHFNSRYFAN